MSERVESFSSSVRQYGCGKRRRARTLRRSAFESGAESNVLFSKLLDFLLQRTNAAPLYRFSIAVGHVYRGRGFAVFFVSRMTCPSCGIHQIDATASITANGFFVSELMTHAAAQR